MKVVKLFLLVICAVLTSANSERSIIESRIVGGQLAEAGQFPYQVSLRTRFSRKHYCGASIISARFLLTAAHCTERPNSYPALIIAVVGAVRRRFDGVAVLVDKIIPHEGWDQSKQVNDIALIRTASEIDFSTNIQPIALSKQNIGENIPLVLSGWGARSV